MQAIVEPGLETPESSDFFAGNDAQELFDATAQRYLNISGEEFLRRWDAGFYKDPSVRTRAMRVALLIPMVRSVSARKNSL